MQWTDPTAIINESAILNTQGILMALEVFNLLSDCSSLRSHVSEPGRIGLKGTDDRLKVHTVATKPPMFTPLVDIDSK